jgi:hypothetical protein
MCSPKPSLILLISSPQNTYWWNSTFPSSITPTTMITLVHRYSVTAIGWFHAMIFCLLGRRREMGRSLVKLGDLVQSIEGDSIWIDDSRIEHELSQYWLLLLYHDDWEEYEMGSHHWGSSIRWSALDDHAIETLWVRSLWWCCSSLEVKYPLVSPSTPPSHCPLPTSYTLRTTPSPSTLFSLNWLITYRTLPAHKPPLLWFPPSSIFFHIINYQINFHLLTTTSHQNC